MLIEFASFAFIITLAAVVNGLGIVRWLTGLAEYLRRKNSLNIRHYWVLGLFASFQFLLHILLWWSMWGVRGAADINFLMYLYMLAGPVLLYLGSSVLVPDIGGAEIDMKAHYFSVRPTYSTVLALLWLWALFMSPMFRGTLAPTAPVLGLFFVFAVTQRISAHPRIQAILATLNWLLLLLFIASFAMQLGGANA